MPPKNSAPICQVATRNPKNATFVIVTDPAEGFPYHSFKESGVL